MTRINVTPTNPVTLVTSISDVEVVPESLPLIEIEVLEGFVLPPPLNLLTVKVQNSIQLTNAVLRPLSTIQLRNASLRPLSTIQLQRAVITNLPSIQLTNAVLQRSLNLQRIRLSGSINGVQEIALTFDLELNTSNVPDANDFTINPSGVISSITAAGTTLILRTSGFEETDSVALSYSPGDTPITAINGSILEAFSNVAVTNDLAEDSQINFTFDLSNPNSLVMRLV